MDSLGGRLRSVSQSFVAPLTEAALEQMSFDRVLLGADAGIAEASAWTTTSRPGSMSPWPGGQQCLRPDGLLQAWPATLSRGGSAGADPGYVRKFRDAGVEVEVAAILPGG